MLENDANHEARLKELRERLYSRGQPPASRERRELPDTEIPVPRVWQSDGTTPPEYRMPVVTPDYHHEPLLTMKKPSRAYRGKLIVGGLIFFVVALLLSGSFLFFGGNTISGENIDMSVTGPFVVGGGEELPLQVTISNRNAVPIEAATLIIEYPYGTQSSEEKGKEMFRERKLLAPINPGEVVNVPLRARMFGEENEEKTVITSIEYRVQGSNATFFIEADPFRFKISSSPIVLFIENVTKSASGQEVELKVSVTSNSPEPLANVLLKAEYPQGFDFTESKPGPVSGQDTWSVANLKALEKRSITIKGVLIGKQSETKVFKFSVGVPNERDRFSLASIFSTQTEEIKIEDPFLELAIDVNGDSGASPVVAPGSTALVTVKFTNTLSTTLYDGKITVDLKGTGLNESQIQAHGGFYDSSSNTIIWDALTTDSLKTMQPGRSSIVTFGAIPLSDAGAPRTPQITFSVNAEGNRVSENQVSERLTGTASKTIKVESVANLSSSVFYSVGAFTNTGPIPPRAEDVTTYTMHLYVKNGTNAIADGVVTMSLPIYVTWLDLTNAGPTFAYNPQTREVSWKVGDLDAASEREAEFQFSFKPSLTQVGQVVTLIEEQRLRATDRFTGTTIRDNAPAVTTRLFSDPKYEKEEGRVEGKNN